MKSRMGSKSEGREAPSEVREQWEGNKAGQAMQSGCHVPKVRVCCGERTGERCCQLASPTDLHPTEDWTGLRTSDPHKEPYHQPLAGQASKGQRLSLLASGFRSGN